MLSKIDRVQIAVPDAEIAARGWIGLLDAEPDGHDRVAGLGATRLRLRVGSGVVEFLQPDGAGLIADAVAKRGAHLFAAGASSHDMAGLSARLAAKGVTPLAESGQLHLSEAETGVAGFRLVLSAAEVRPRVGLIDYLYEATILSDDTSGLTRQLNALLGLDENNYSEITSEIFGYRARRWRGIFRSLARASIWHLQRRRTCAPSKTAPCHWVRASRWTGLLSATLQRLPIRCGSIRVRSAA